MADVAVAAAWAALAKAWAWQWAAIFLLGVVPAEALGRVPRIRHRGWAQAGRRICAGFAAMLCLASAPLAFDTYRLESGDPRALEALNCMARREVRQGAYHFTCERTGSMERVASLVTSPDASGPGVLLVLGITRKPVLFFQTPAAAPAP